MKAFALSLLLASGLILRADDNSLQNGDFSTGLDHWSGDVVTPDTASSTSAAGTGVAIELRADWTKITQDFNAKRGHYFLTVTYSLAPNTTFSSERKDYRKIPERLGFTALKKFGAHPGEWCVIITDRKRYLHCEVTPASADSSLQTVTGRIDLPTDGDNQTFCLAFPPGHGVVILHGISFSHR